MREFLATIASLRDQVSKWLRQLPAWNEIVRISEMACSPLVSFAHAVLRTLPALRRLEWLLEIESLTRRHPVGLAFSMLYVLWRGLRVTPLGHIGTDPIIYPLLGAISGFNPFLGLVCGALYGVGDLAQKFVWPDIYGARGWTDKNYWGAMGGYLVAYSSLMIMGVLPGLLSRVFRTVTRSIIRNYMFRRAAASADGATPLDEGTYPLAEMLAGAAGGFAGGYYAMHQVAPYTESPAFYWRPVPDNSCHHLEVGTHLKGRADVGGAGSAFGGLGRPWRRRVPSSIGDPTRRLRSLRSRRTRHYRNRRMFHRRPHSEHPNRRDYAPKDRTAGLPKAAVHEALMEAKHLLQAPMKNRAKLLGTTSTNSRKEPTFSTP